MRKFGARLGVAGTVVILAGAVLLVRHERLLASPGEARNARARAAALAGGAPAPGHADDATDIYAADRPGMLSPVVQNFPSRIYVPNSDSNTVDVIDPVTFKVIDHFSAGAQPQHVVPSYDLKTLWVLNDKGNSLTKIDPATGKKGETVPVDDPYNLYFTPNGSQAIVVAEALHRLDFRDAQTMKLIVSLHVPCAGVNHMDYAADGSYFIASCEFDGHLLKIETATRKILGKLALDPKDMPQDVRTSPDGKIFYVADMMANGVHIIDADKFAKIGFLATGKGAHGLLIGRGLQADVHLEP